MFVVGDIIRNNATQYPNKIGLIWEGNRFTWWQTDERVNRLTHGLFRLGLSKGDGVGIMLRNCHQWVETGLAVAKGGFRMVPANLMLKERELIFILNDSDAKVLVVDAQMADMVARMVAELPQVEHVIGVHEGHGLDLDFEQLLADSPAHDGRWPVSGDDVLMTIYTSGTTGQPKGAMLSQYNMSSAAVCEGYEYRLVPTDVCMNFVPLFFIGGWGSTCLPFLLRGCTHHILSFDPEKVLAKIEEEKVTCTIMVPTIINMLTNHPSVSNYDYSSLRAIPFAGSALPVEHWRKARKIFGDVFVSAYGFTEGCGTVCILQPEDVNVDGTEKEVRRLASCGKAMAQTAIRLVDPDGNDIPPGYKEIGEISVKGSTIFKGYWKDPPATAEALKDGWFYTGDLATRDEDGFLYIVDRKKDMIISGGINVYPREIEEIIYTHPAVLDCCVIGVPDEKWGETVRAVITVKPTMEVVPEEIMDLCARNLASYKKPTAVDIVPDIPKTASGKLLKRELREQYWKGHERKV